MVRTREAANAIGVSPNSLRCWELRFGFPRPARSAGGHRQYERRQILALRLAVDEGLSGKSAVDRAVALCRAGVVGEPRSLQERMTRLEAEVKQLRRVVEMLVVEMQRARAAPPPSP